MISSLIINFEICGNISYDKNGLNNYLNCRKLFISLQLLEIISTIKIVDQGTTELESKYPHS